MYLEYEYFERNNPVGVSLSDILKPHKCMLCGRQLKKESFTEIIDYTSPEIQYFYHSGFVMTAQGIRLAESGRVSRPVLVCETCQREIEFLSQKSIENLFIALERIKAKLNAKGVKVEFNVNSCIDHILTDKLLPLKKSSDIAITVLDKDKKIGRIFLPVLRKAERERPHYLEIHEKKLAVQIEEIAKNSFNVADLPTDCVKLAEQSKKSRIRKAVAKADLAKFLKPASIILAILIITAAIVLRIYIESTQSLAYLRVLTVALIGAGVVLFISSFSITGSKFYADYYNEIYEENEK